MSDPDESGQSNAARLREINDSIRYTMWSVFSLRDTYGNLGDEGRVHEANELDGLVEKLAADDVVVRGVYDLSGFRADAEKRPKSRDLKPLARVLPFVMAHAGDAVAAALFLLVSTGATLAITGAARRWLS